ncbi:ubiquitin carboxyl-terminal hydrolase CYLD isoform X1 [Palaemon carinicauda]|uniref:ubiquitin carboxyl-terminal hydrolase CYLD isoform X1 n=2 Tax=Palaemon carinicauda TaxID=392227 RepID=UPI0035B63C55
MEGSRRKSHSSGAKVTSEECGVSVGDRVVWLSEEYPELGWVRWTGKLSGPGDPSGWMVGVEFDNPVGSDNHRVNSRPLFEAKMNHASVLPVTSLMKAEDFLGSEAINSDQHGIPNSGGKKSAHLTSKGDNQLSSDINSMTPFQLLAYEQLTAGGQQRSSGPPPPPYTEKDDWELLPHMTYSSQKNMSSSNKETLHDHKSRPRDKSKMLNRSSEKKNNKWKSQGSGGRSSNVNNEHEQGSPVGGLGETDFPVNPLYHLSRHGIDQLEVVSDGDGSVYETPEGSIEGTEEDLDIGSMVEVVIKEVPRFGVIRWIGTVPGDKKEGRKVAGVEMEDTEDGLSDGTFSGKRYFTCATGKALFVPLRMCHKDSRFLESISSNPRASLGGRSSRAFGSMDCQPVGGSVPPLSTQEEVQAMFGKNRGIQGHQNSCYLDATLFSMFAFTSVFDNLLFRPPTPHDIKEYNEVQRVLREEIVNPLRANLFVRADRIMKLRTMLDHLSSVRGLTTEEKDPEEFLHSLLAQILQAEPFLQLSSGQEAYHYQLFVDKDEKLNLPSVQTLFDQSFLTSDIKLKQVPSCLIIQMPRFGKDYKMYPRILPSMVLDVTDVIEDSPRQCIICGKLAEYECRECFGQCGSGLESIAFCAKCMDKVHSHKKRGCHASTRKLKVPPDFQMLADHCGSIPRVYMELFAVVCIETSHYVAFTRCGSGADATWCFFDSMADRKGEQHGYNIPTVVECGDLMQWVGEEGSQMLHAVTDNKALPDLPRRLLCDAYMCFYMSPKVMMYR